MAPWREPEAKQNRAITVQKKYLSGKRTFDLIVGGSLAILTIPFQALMLAGSAISFRAWPIFSQDRVGLNGELFTFRKIRSLPANAPSEADKYTIMDVRNSRFGTFVRASHFDELLQLWSVASGKMSLVGPRPEMVGLSESYDPAFVAERTSVRPGVTGLWQVSRGVHGLIGETPEYDQFYVRRPSWKLDVWVMIKTVTKMIGHRTVGPEDIAGFVETMGDDACIEHHAIQIDLTGTDMPPAASAAQQSA